ncbi:MAG: hypothetical protein ACI9P5_002818, partial [Saprospiraceae bacterium]
MRKLLTIFSVLGIVVLTVFTTSAQAGCATSNPNIAAEFNDQMPDGVSVYEFTVLDETPTGAADPDFYQVEWPVLPSGGYSDFNNTLGSTQSDSIFCVYTTDESNEGPDIVLNLVVPSNATMTCSELSMTICRVGDFNGSNEAVWIVNKELMDISPNSDHVMACIPGTGGGECQGYGAINCVTVVVNSDDIGAFISDGLLTIALITAGGIAGPMDNDALHTDANCADPGETGNCFRLQDFSFHVIEEPTIISIDIPDLCVGETSTASVIAAGTAPLTYTWSVVSGNITLGTNGSSTIDITSTASGAYTLNVTVENNTGMGSCQGAAASDPPGNIFPNPVLTDPTNVGPVCSNIDYTFTSTASSGTTPYSYNWQFSSDSGVSFSDLINGSEYSGVNTPTLTVLSPEISKNNFQYRATVVDNNDCAGSASVSSAATLMLIDCSPIIDVTKELASTSTAISGLNGNVDATYEFTVCNVGPVDVIDIDLYDDFNSLFGSSYIGVTTLPSILPSTTAASGPTANLSFLGLGLGTNLLNSDGTLSMGSPGECVTLNVVIELDLDLIPYGVLNQATGNASTSLGYMATDLSDNDAPTGTPNGDFSGNDPDNLSSDDDDATPFPQIASLKTTKALTNTNSLSNGNVNLTFDLSVENTGNVNLSSLSLLDDLTDLGVAYQSGTSSISVSAGSATMVASDNTGIFDGTSSIISGGDGDLLSGAVTDLLEPGQMYTAQLNLEVNPTAFVALMASMQDNQATAFGVPVDAVGTQILALNIDGSSIAIGNQVSDLSDDPADLPFINENDPTPIVLPGIIDVSKQLTTLTNPSISTVPGNVDATYTFNICNNGGSDLTGISLLDNFSSQFGSGFIGVVVDLALGTSTATSDPSLATTFTGYSPNNNLFSGNDGTLSSGQCVAVTVMVELDLDQIPDSAENQATAIAQDDGTGNSTSDISDNDAPTGTPNGDATGDDQDDPLSNDNDPTPFPPTPGINVAKSVNLVEAAPIADRYYITYRHRIQNTGNTALQNLSLKDDISTALCGGYIGTTNINVLNVDADTPPTPSVAITVMDGLNDALGNNGLLLPGESFIVDIVVEADITLTTCNQPYLNQSTAEGLPTDGLGTTLNDPATGVPYVDEDVNDLSDSGTDPDSNNAGAPNDGNGPNIYDDPTPVNLPGTIGLVKNISNVTSSVTTGNYLVTLDFYIENTDGSDLINITLVDDLSSQWGDAFVGIIFPPSISVAGGDGATSDPTPNTGYDGILDNSLLNANGELSPGESITVQVTVEVDASESSVSGVENQATVTGTDPNGYVVMDLSDDNTSSGSAPDADGDNPNGSGDDGSMDTNNPSPLFIPEISTTKKVTNISSASSGTQGNYDLTFSFTIENTGTTIIEDVALVDDVSSQLNPAYVGMVQEAMITSSSASTNPMVGNMPNLLDGTTGILFPGESVIIEIIVEIDASVVPSVGLTNQATATGTPTDGAGNSLPDPSNPGSNLGNVSDTSDSGGDPQGSNPSEPGDMGTSDDPTPLPPLPAITVQKMLTALPTTAASGEIGHFDATYQFEICNDGSVDLFMINLKDNISAEFGAGFVGVVAAPSVVVSTANSDPTPNTGYTGYEPNDNLLIGTDGVLESAECVTIELTIEVDALEMPVVAFNQAEASGQDPTGSTVTDLSDDNSDTDLDMTIDNESGGTNDPTPFPNVSAINTTKALENSEVLPNDNVAVTFRFNVQNTGTEILSDLTTYDPLSFPVVSSTITVLTQPTTGNLIANSTFDGTGMVGSSSANLITDASGITASLNPGDSYVLEAIFIVDPVVVGALPQPIVNQTTAQAAGFTSGTMVSDVSDDGSDLPGGGNPMSINLGSDDDTGTSNDPTTFTLPGIIEVAKTLTNVPSPAASGSVGNFDAVYQFEVCNIGGVQLDMISLMDNLNSQFGSGFVGIVAAPSIFASTAVSNPTTNISYSGFSPNDNLLSGTDGLLNPGQCVTIQIEVEIDASELPKPALNQAESTGRDPEGNLISDLSDDETDLDNNDENIDGDNDPSTGGDNDSGGTNDPTLFPPTPDISVAKLLSSADVQNDGDVKLTFEFLVQNIGNTSLSMISLVDQLQFLPISAPTSQNIEVSVTNISAQAAPNPNPSYSGEVGNLDLLTSVDGFLNPGEEFMVTLNVDVDPVSFALIAIQPVVNQATALGVPVDSGGAAIPDPSDSMNGPMVSVSDLSDDGSDPNTDNPGAPGDSASPGTDSPTPIPLPGIIDVTKELISLTPATVQGNAIASYEFIVCNIGGVDLTNIDLTDDMSSEFGSGFVGLTIAPVLTGAGTPTANVNFTGYSPNINMLNGDGLLTAGQCNSITVQVELDIDLLPVPAFNQAVAIGFDPSGDEISDLSDDNSDIDGDTNNDNETGGEDDPTGLPSFTSIGIAKNVSSVEVHIVEDQYEITFQLIVENNGSAILEEVSIFDEVATMCGFQNVVSGSISILPGANSPTLLPGANNSYNGTAGSSLINGTSLNLASGESFIVEFSIVIDPGSCTQPMLNQASAEGVDADNNTVTDNSDSGTNTSGTNPGMPGDTGGFDDPTPFTLPGSISITKSMTNYTNSVSGVDGNYDVTYEFMICNDGGVKMKQITLEDALSNQLGSAFVQVVSGYFAGNTVLATESGATDPTTATPTGNNGFTGFTGNINLLNGDGELSPSECVTVQVVVEVDISDSPALGLVNQAISSGIDPDGLISEDASDDATINGNDSGGTNDPTYLNIPEIRVAKSVYDITPAATTGNSIVTYEITLENTGTVKLEDLTLVDDVNGNLNDAYISIVSNPTISSSSATTDPALAAFFPDDFFNGSSGKLLPGEYVTVQFSVEVINANLDTPQLNTAAGTSTQVNPDGSIGITITDNSDSGTVPSSTNPGEPGDTGGTDDPTPLQVPGALDVTKELVSIVDATTSGNVYATYRFTIKNIGGSNVDDFNLIDDLSSQFGLGFVDIQTAPAVSVGSNFTMLSTLPTSSGTGYTGISPTINMLQGDGSLALGEDFIVTAVAEIDLDKMPVPATNQAIADGTDTFTGNPVEDDSDNDNPMDPDDPNSDDDDPTPFPATPKIEVTKQLVSSKALDNGDVKLTFYFVITNSGNTDLNDLNLIDDLSAIFPAADPVSQNIMTTVGGNATELPIISFYTGVVPFTSMLTANGGLMAPGEFVTVSLMIEVDPVAFSMIIPAPVNQATALGEDPTGIQVEDLSDDPTIPTDVDPNMDGSPDDPTPIILPAILEVSKTLLGVPGAAASGDIGNFDLTYEFNVCNIGGLALTDINLYDDLNNQFGNGFVGLTSLPSISVSGVNTTLLDPTVNSGYTGYNPNDNLLNGEGGLESGECISVQLSIEVDASELPIPAANQAIASGIDPNGEDVSDDSDDNTDLDNDMNPDNESGGEDDPTIFPFTSD